MSNYSEIVNFIISNEGKILFPYYPGMKVGRQKVAIYPTYAEFKSHYSAFISAGQASGVTIGSGIDFGGRSTSDPIFNAITDPTKRALLKTACGLKHSGVLDWLWNNQATFGSISSTESDNLTKQDLLQVRIPAAKRSCNGFDQLSSNIQTAIVDISMNGTGHAYFKNAVKYVNSGDYVGLSTYVLTQKYANISSARRNKLSELVLQGGPIGGNVVNAIGSDGNIETHILPQNKVSENVNYIKGVAIGNEIVLSNYSPSDDSREFFKNIFTKSGLDVPEINALLSGLGVSDSGVSKYLQDNSVSLTNENCEKILMNMIVENRKRAENNLSLSFKDHPREVNTAIISFIFDMGLSGEVEIKTISNQISTLLKSKNYEEIANIIERYAEGKIESVKFKRVNEARLIRLRKSNDPNYIEDESEQISGDYLNGKSSGLESDVVNARNNLKNTRHNNDETYQEVTKEVSNSFADLLEKQQVITDRHMAEEEGDYLHRLRIINLYSNRTRNENKTYYQVERDIENSGKVSNDYRLNSAYNKIPYGDGLYVTTKQNAINRAKYRIKQLMHSLSLIQSELIEKDVFEFISDSRYLSTMTTLANEKKNLNNLRADLIHYERSSTSR